MIISDLLADVAAALRQDAQIANYVAAAWPGRSLAVHDDVDRERPPQLAAHPMIWLDVAERQISADLSAGVYLVTLAVAARGPRSHVDGLAVLAAKRAAREMMRLGVAITPAPVQPDYRWNDSVGCWYGFSARIHDPI